MNPIDTQQNQTLSALITTEAKEMVRSEHDEMTLDEYDKMLDNYEALYATDDESSDSEC